MRAQVSSRHNDRKHSIELRQLTSLSLSLSTQETQMQKQNLRMSLSLPPSNQEIKKPCMASQETAPQCRPGGGDAADNSASAAPEEFQFCILSSGALAPAGEDAAAGMCVADEVFSDGKLLPLRLSTATSADASALLLLRSDSLDGATTAVSISGFSSRPDSRSASSSSSSSVSRSNSLKSASSYSVGRSHSSKSASSDAVAPPRRSLSSSLFYAHSSPSPRPPPRRNGGSAASAARRSTGSAPPAAWGIIRLGVVGAPEVYPRRAAESRKAAAARGGSRSARFAQPSAASKEAVALEKKLALGLLGAGLVCNCSPDAVEPVGSAEAAAAATRRRKKAEEKKKGGVKSGQSTVRRSWILEWLEELSIARDKSVV